MPGFNPDNINIHDLTIEEPEKREQSSSVVFDPERDVTDEQWQAMEKEVIDIKNLHYEDKGFTDFLQKAAELQIVFPDRKINPSEISEDVWNNIKNDPDLIALRGELLEGVGDYVGNEWFAADLLENARILFKERAGELLNDEAKESLEKGLARLRKEVDDPGSFIAPKNYMAFAVKMKIIFPEAVAEANLDNEIIAKNAEEYLMDERSRGAWANFLEGAASMKILYPEHLKNLNLNQAFWEEVIGGVKTIEPPEGHWQGMELSTLAKFLKILAAQEVKITEKGLELVMPTEKKSLTSETPEIPEQRKF